MVVCLIIAAGMLIGAAVFLLIKYVDHNSRKWIYSYGQFIAAGSVFNAAVVLFLPIYFRYFSNDALWSRLIKTGFISFHNGIRLFVVDGEYDIIQNYISGFFGGRFYVPAILYGLLAGVLYILAPVLTAGIIISFFNNFFSQFRFVNRKGKNFYIFSELNEDSLALAQSIYENETKRNNSFGKNKRKWKKSCFVFTDVYDDKSERMGELLIKIRTLPSATFKLDILENDFKRRLKRANVYFVLIGKDEDEKIAQAAGLVEKYEDAPNVSIHMISNREEVDSLFYHSNVPFFRVDPAKDMIYQFLYNDGKKLFEQAIPGDKENEIGAVILGLGSYGTNMVRSLAWYLQMDGYHFRIDAFDLCSNAEDRFRAQCPELLDERLNGRDNPEGEARFDIRIHSGTDILSYSFYEELRKIKPVTFVFISLGSDSLNVKVARTVRSLLEREGFHPAIMAISYNDDLNAQYVKMKTNNRIPYDLQFLGNEKQRFSYDVIFHTELQRRAEQLHLINSRKKEQGVEIKETPEEEERKIREFWNNCYSYESSCASVIHMKARKECGIPGSDKNINDMTEEEKLIISVLEHKRWNMYIRSIGYVLGPQRNHLKKTHDCLIPFDDLDEVSQRRYEDDRKKYEANLEKYERAKANGEDAKKPEEPEIKDLKISDLHTFAQIDEELRERNNRKK